MRERAACPMRHELIGLAVGLLGGVAFAADVSFEGALHYTRADGAECEQRPPEQQRAVVHRLVPPQDDAEWLIEFPDGTVRVLERPTSDPSARPRWTLDAAPAAAATARVELAVRRSGPYCEQEARFTAAAPAGSSMRASASRSATRLLDESDDAMRRQQWAEARGAAERALEMQIEALGADHPGAHRALLRAALAQAWQGDIVGSLPRLERACPLQAVDLARLTRAQARCGIHRLEPMLWAGQLREATALAKAIVPLADAQLTVAEQVLARLLGAEALRLSSRLAEATGLAEQAQEMAERELPAGHRLQARALGTVALAYMTGGRPGATEAAERAVTSHRSIFGDAHVRTGVALGTLGLSYLEAGRLAEALLPAERGFAVVADAVGAEHFITLRSMMGLANAYLLLGREPEALDMYVKAEAGFRRLFGEGHNGRLIALRNIGVAQRRLELPEQALNTDLELLAAARAAYGTRHESTLAALRSLGTDYFELGRLDEALTVNEESLVLHESVYGPQHQHTLHQRSHHARILRGMKRYDESIAEGERVLADVERYLGGTHHDALGVMGMLADSYEFSGRVAEARALNEEYVRRFEPLLAATSFSAEWRQAYFASVINVYRNLTRYYLIEGRADDAFRISELTKARTLLEALSLKRAEDSGVLPSGEIGVVSEIEAAVAQLDLRIGAAKAMEERLRLEGERNEAAQRLAAERERLRLTYPRYAQLTEVRPTASADAPKLVDTHTALISYALADRRLAAFVITRDGITAHDLGNLEALAGVVEAYRHMIDPQPGIRVWRLGADYIAASVAPAGAGAGAVSLEEVGERLARQLYAPLAARLKGKRHWLISPDGPLATLPFEALPLEGRPAIERRSIAYVQSVSVLALMRERPPRKGRASDGLQLFAMGAPAYRAPAAPATAGRRAVPVAAIDAAFRRGGVQRAYEVIGQQWQPLPGTALEVKSIAALFGRMKTTALLGTEASESNLKERDRAGEMARYRYLHFAAHGYLSTEVPALSALVLSQVGNPPGVDGYLTAAEWPLYRLDSDLIVLSACQTGLGKQVSGQGVMGLPYALFVAGNRQTLLTLWPVADDSAARFMTRFYARLRAGLRPRDALAAVKRETVLDRRHSAPLHWAGFVLYGD